MSLQRRIIRQTTNVCSSSSRWIMCPWSIKMERMHYPCRQIMHPPVYNNQHHIQASSMEVSQDAAISYVFLSVYMYTMYSTFITLLCFFVQNFYKVIRGLNLCLAVWCQKQHQNSNGGIWWVETKNNDPFNYLPQWCVVKYQPITYPLCWTIESDIWEDLKITRA